MNWTRTILDGLAMAAYFNLFAAAVALYKPRLMFPCYPTAIIKAAEEPPTKDENRFYWLWICFGELLPLLPRNRRASRLWVQSLDEGLRSAGASASVAALTVPAHGGGSGGIVSAVAKNMIIRRWFK